MKYLFGAATLAAIMTVSAPSYAQFGGGGGGGLNGTGDAAAQNLPSTVGVGHQTGNGYYTGVGGGERPYYSGRSAYRDQPYYDGPSSYRRGYWGSPYQPY